MGMWRLGAFVAMGFVGMGIWGPGGKLHVGIEANGDVGKLGNCGFGRFYICPSSIQRNLDLGIPGNGCLGTRRT